MFSTVKKDPDSRAYLKGNPVSMMATNITNLMGGRTNLWKESGNKVGLLNPYGKSF